MSVDNAEAPVHEWIFGGRTAFWMNVAVIPATFLGLFGFGWLNGVLRSEGGAAAIPANSLRPAVTMLLGAFLGFFGLTILVFAIHEVCHGLAFRWAGAKPRYGAKLIGGFLPVFYATAPGRWLTRRQYTTMFLTPTVVVNALGIALMVAMPQWSWLWVIPLGFHFGGCVADWWLVCVVSRFPRGTQFEDTPQGFRYQLEPAGTGPTQA